MAKKKTSTRHARATQKPGTRASGKSPTANPARRATSSKKSSPGRKVTSKTPTGRPTSGGTQKTTAKKSSVGRAKGASAVQAGSVFSEHKGALAGGAGGALLGAIAGPIGAAIGATIGAAAGAFADTPANKTKPSAAARTSERPKGKLKRASR